MRHFYSLSVMGLTFATIGLLAIGGQDAAAYEEWTSSGCGSTGCHGDFRSNPYTSKAAKDGVSWGDDLMGGHQVMLAGSSNCGVCHTGSVNAGVKIASSDGAGGLAPLGCLGCHGRDEGSGVTGAGLRQEHQRNGVSCGGCHSDNNPATFTPVGEGAMPPYYANPGSFTGIPTHPCNLPAQSNPETRFGSWGLDNNGDGLYDVVEATDDCSSVAPIEDSTWGRIKELFRLE